MDPIIRLAGVSKEYRIYRGPRAVIREFLFGRSSHHTVQALVDVDLDISRGEAFGVVGDNGAGKSTLLKILSGTALPTRGKVELRDSVSALLELGAGFHPEFTGRENIFFSGSLMGMSREEVRERESEILEFAGLGEFIDQPVKTYSSGMYLRLGFAVATGFDPAIIIIDEALAVGDQRFQKKCMDRILGFREKGRTILFCSHNLLQVRALCDRALWLNRGTVQGIGAAAEVIDRYSDWLRESGQGPVAREETPKQESTLCTITRVVVSGEVPLEPVDRVQTGGRLQVDVWADFAPGFGAEPGISVAIVRNDGVIISAAASIQDGFRLNRTKGWGHHARIVFPHLELMSGLYSIDVAAVDPTLMQAWTRIEKAASFTVETPGPHLGCVRLKHEWDLEPL